MGLTGKGNEGCGIGEAASDRLELGLSQRAQARPRLEPGIDRLVWAQREIEVGKRWGVEQAKGRLRRFDQGDIDRKLRPTLDEALGTVEGIDEKEAIRGGGDAAVRDRFLGDDGH